MPPRGFDRFMVANQIGTNRKLRRLPVAERWAYVAGVLALASQSPIRGALLITDREPVTAEDVAAEATVTIAQARSALAALRRLGMLQRDGDGIEWVHDWDDLNPSPKPSDAPEAARQRKREQRARDIGDGHAPVTPDVTRDIGVTSRPMSRAGHAMSRREVEVEGEEQESAGALARDSVDDPHLIETVEILRTCKRLEFDPLLAAVSNVMAAYPSADHVQAAHVAAANAADATYRTTDAGKALRYAIQELERSAPRPRQQRTDAKPPTSAELIAAQSNARTRAA